MCNEVDNNFVFFITHQLISAYNMIIDVLCIYHFSTAH